MGMVLNGLLPDASVGMTRRLDPERWEVAEGRTAELISCIQPNEHSEGRRLAVYHYVQRIIASCLSCPVFTFGSVPLKTYLPDGDIDVTAVGHSEELKEIWANLVRDALEREEKNENAEFHVKEVQYIQAEVKIIKCLVENIVVDISYNQVGGLCTLCFLEQADKLINRNHLFKRSIILIKAWCFYESRILGAHHGLISTYALETLVLYIFHIFHNCFTGPLEVLFRFLEFFSNFDWEKFCLSLSGPVPISSLPDITAEPPRMDSGKLLLSKAFLDFCSSMYGVVPHTQESQGQPFVSKHFNVIDPLRTGNNLGRSVSKGNFFRIRNAFAFGAKSLGKLLECSKENLTAQLNQFFANTWIRHGNGSRPDVPIPNLLDVRSLKVFSQNHLAGIPPASLIGTPWLPNMQFFHGFIQPPMAHYIHNPTFAPKSEDGNESDRPVTSDENHDTGNNWHEYTVGFSGHFSSEGRDPHIYDVDGNEHSSLPNGVPVAPLERQMEFTIEDNGVGDENYTHVIQSQTGGEASGYVNAPYSYASSSGDKAMNVSSWDEMSVNTSRSLSDKWGKRPSFAAPAPTTHSKVGWQMGSSLEHLPTEVDDGPRNGTSGSTINEASEIVAGPNPLSVQSRAGQVPNEFDQSQMGVPNPMSASFLIGSQQRQADSSGLTLVPTASPVPFVVLPFFPGTSDGSVPQFEQSEGTDQHPANSVGKKFSSLNEVHQPDTSITSTAFCGIMAEPPSDEHKPDILNSDLIGHWRNLQYGRFCQNAPPVGPVFYPFMVPQMYLQSHAPWDGPGRPVAPNVNWTQMVGPGQRVFPVMPVQPTTERLTGGLQHYGEDAPRYRAGTGTYFPNPKAPFRDRHSSSRNYRGGYSNDRSDHSDKEGSWANSKHRNPNRSYGRSQSERSGMRPDRHATDDNQSDRQRRTYRNDSYRHDSGAQYLMQGQYFGSTNSMRKPANVTHEVYTPPSAASNGGALSGPPGPPFLMMCSYKPGVNHGASSSEPIEFGSLGPLPTANGDDMPRPTRQVMPNGFYGQKRGPYRGGSSHSSPDQPSSPQPRR
ncbi:hypothetical protein QOZ80_3BG0289580 [Eleusine coracana subsp. coracana]|nr:hypothetical protein QOZ80_3BG0289580 [Eleusine coracana subsp. coracana]